MHATFGVTFLIAARWGERSALCFGIAFLCVAVAFIPPVVSIDLSPQPIACTTDVLIAAAALCFGQATAEHFGVGRRWLGARLAICAGSVILSIHAVADVDDLRMEVLVRDIGCVLLLGLPLAGIRWRALRSFDLWLLIVAWLVTLESAVRGVSSPFTLPDQMEGFTASRYVYVMQAVESVLGMILAMVGLAAVALSVVARYRRLAMIDPLSGLLNRRGFEEEIAMRPEWRDPPASIVACDIDRFKTVNDRFGHPAGDAVIRALADIIRERLPEGGIATRFGGEEFILVLPGQSTGKAFLLAEAVRAAFEAEGAEMAGIDALVTVSCGLSAISASDFSVHDAISRADTALYAAKHDGRNRVAIGLPDEMGLEPPQRAAILTPSAGCQANSTRMSA